MSAKNLLHLGKLLFLGAHAGTHARAVSANDAPPLLRQQQENGAGLTSTSKLSDGSEKAPPPTVKEKPSVAPLPALLGEPTPAVAWDNDEVDSMAVVPWGAVVQGLFAAIVTASNQTTLVANLNSNTNIYLGADIYLTSSGSPDGNYATGIIIDNGQANLVIDGMGVYKIDGQKSVRCIYISGSGVNVVFQNLEITNGYTVMPNIVRAFRVRFPVSFLC